jgi:ABC-type cobalamin transport system ATPase subunit
MVVTTAEAVRPPEELGLVKLEGVVSQLDDGQWQIGPALFRTTAVTRVSGQLIPGARAVVWGLPREDGSLDVIQVDVLDTRSLIAP